MSEEELKINLLHLINRYVDDEQIKDELRNLIATRDPIPVKGILADITPHLKGKTSAQDSEIIKD